MWSCWFVRTGSRLGGKILDAINTNESVTVDTANVWSGSTAAHNQRSQKRHCNGSKSHSCSCGDPPISAINRFTVTSVEELSIRYDSLSMKSRMRMKSGGSRPGLMRCVLMAGMGRKRTSGSSPLSKRPFHPELNLRLVQGFFLSGDPAQPEFLQANCQVHFGGLDLVLPFGISLQLDNLTGDGPVQ
jgi:hypothetical protein